MTRAWVCDFCGHEGRSDDGSPVEAIACPMCGEPVTPVPLP